MQQDLFEVPPARPVPTPRRENIGLRLRFAIFKRDDFRCVYCGKRAPPDGLEVDHVVAVISGGTNDPRNLVTACFDCNRGKADIPIADTSALNRGFPPTEPLPAMPKSIAVEMGRRGGKAGTAAQLAQRRAAAVNGGRPRQPLPCRVCGGLTLGRDASRRPLCGGH